MKRRHIASSRGGSPRLRVAIGVFALLVAAAGFAKPEFPNPKVTGPIPFAAADGQAEHDYPFFSNSDWLADRGYLEEEFFLEGEANRYDVQAGAIQDSGHPYKTRLLVRRPAKASDFNGTVLLEWQNVTAGYDLDALWSSVRHHLTQAGYAWVGISAQRVGVNQLREWSPKRYGSLDVTKGGEINDDALSYDIFAQSAQSIRNPGEIDPMGGLEVKEIIGEGASQSAGRLIPYFNVAQPLHEPVIDLLFLAVGGGATRTDTGIPVFRMLSETDVLGSLRRGREMQPQSDMNRRWEITGSSHSSFAGFVERQLYYERDHGQPSAWPDCNSTPYPRVPSHKVYNAAYAAMVRWVRDGVAPPIPPEITRDGNDVKRDMYGNALGGISLAEHAVATATNDGINAGNARFCILYGSYAPFDEATINKLYPTHADYLQKVIEVSEANVKAGFLLRQDADETERLAATSLIGGFPAPEPTD